MSGVMPLALSSGAGSGAQHAVGTGVIGGMFVVRGSREFRDVRKQFLGARHIEFATGQHEVGLRVHFPQDQIQRYHAISV